MSETNERASETVTRVTRDPLLECQCGSRHFYFLTPIRRVACEPASDIDVEHLPVQCPGCGLIWEFDGTSWIRRVYGRNLQVLRVLGQELQREVGR